MTFGASCSAGNANAPDGEGARAPSGSAESSPEEFFELLNFTNVTEREHTPEMLIDNSALIVRGRIVGVEEGRSIDYAESASNPINMAVFEVPVDRVLKSGAGASVYFEHIRGGIPVESFREVLPADLPMIVFLREESGWDPPVYRIEGNERGRPKGALLYTYLTECGLVIED